MKESTARSISTAVVGGLAAMVFFRAGIFFWVGLIGWAALAEAGDAPSALKKTIAGLVFGACLAWLAVVGWLMVPVPADGGYWIPRSGIAIAITLYLLEMGTGIDLLSRRTAALLGYASGLGAVAVLILDNAGQSRLTGPHLDNPGIAAIVALVLGALAGHLAGSMTKALSKA